jgi:nitroimidazol reductase NimA-like FMN-containing flavoprotein (pyridoxamine 5'-phosphate oxidase superfamily)
VSTDVSSDEAAPPASERMRVRRRPQRGAYDAASVYAVLDDALLCHVGFVDQGTPFVLPTLHTRMGDRVVIHGSQQNRMLDMVASGHQICLEATVVDSLVLGRSVFQNSMNYRSVVVLGHGSELVDEDEKLAAMHALIDRVVPERLPHLRPLTMAELRSTRVVSIPLTEASVKVRTGPPADKETEYDMPIWAGELPLRVVPGVPVADPHLPSHIEPAAHLTGWGSHRTGV